MEGLIMAAQIILSLSILVGLHEMGHLLAAKAFGMRVEQFSIGFPPRIFSFKYGETEYALSAIPLGGFVKISGMIDESMDKEAMKLPPKPYEFRSKPAWQRLIVMLGGIIVNVITGVIIFIFLTFIYGEMFISNDAINENGGIVALDLGQELGLKTGDKVIKINGQEVEDFSEILNPNTFMGSGAYYTVIRDGEKVNVPIPGDFIDKMNSKEAQSNFVSFNLPTIIEKVQEGSIAEKVGVEKGDRIVEINGKPFEDQKALVEYIKSYKGDSVDFKVKRGGDVLTFTHDFKNDTILGVGFVNPADLYTDQIEYSFGESVPKGTKKAFGIVFLQIKAFGKMFSGDLSVTKSLSGPIGIAKAYGGEWIWERFWSMTGLLSMVLAFMNLLPIPALDGGHVMFLTYEMVSGRKPSDKFLENAQKVGMAFLLMLMVFIIFNDIFKIEFIQNLFGGGS
ncbi:RIP metalloprotease RseP [Fulvivirga sediminis]|uniref:Zinc metalloprotease n=1 Tax=Fulvivirga sediminis TaxID=2803949 RepID=A0A937F9U6_9BACT|nr:RIP metalloprotease RseP [Fulvivirga sediminis]MBL3656583.1 RIP metalloprotease RseP [Fulvivirga sediminis]